MPSVLGVVGKGITSSPGKNLIKASSPQLKSTEISSLSQRLKGRKGLLVKVKFQPVKTLTAVADLLTACTLVLCAVLGCNNCSDRDKHVSYYCIPKVRKKYGKRDLELSME